MAIKNLHSTHCIVTLLIRIIPFIMISKVQLPDVVVRWLSFIPITLFTASLTITIISGIVIMATLRFFF
ncbi:AzlD domain-containing protein [Staphylococcus aureus]|nr:AzlD domain-containing protein [Staphylococcus aureus]